MSNIVLAENLYKSLKEVKRNTIHTLPVLNHILLEFKDGELYLTSTDLDHALQSKCACRMNDEWSTCVLMVHKCEVVTNYNGGYINTSRRKLYPFIDYIKVMADDDATLEFSLQENIQILTIKSGSSTTQFKCLDALEFPQVNHG